MCCHGGGFDGLGVFLVQMWSRIGSSQFPSHPRYAHSHHRQGIIPVFSALGNMPPKKKRNAGKTKSQTGGRRSGMGTKKNNNQVVIL
jgi:hypothetical protein